MKKIIILGSTGSIGKQTLEIIKKEKNKFEILLLSTDKNINLISKQIKTFKDKNIVVTNRKKYEILKNHIELILDTLSYREKKVMQLRFGLEDGRSRTLEEVGDNFGVTRERIRQIEAKALRKLRHPSRSTTLRDFLN